MGLQYWKFFHSKVKARFLWQQSQSSRSFCKIQNLGGQLSEDKFQSFLEGILKVTVSNEKSEVTYWKVHWFSVVKALSFKSLSWISATTFADFIQFVQDPMFRRPRIYWGEILVLHWRKTSYFSFTCISPLVLILFRSYIWRISS